MSKKEDRLSGGLNALFGEAPRREQPEPQTQKPQDEATLTATEQEAEPQPEETTDPNDVINTIEDEELKAALHAKRMQHRGRPRKYSSKSGVAEGYARVTNIMNLSKVKKLHYIAIKETLTLKEIWDECLDIAIERYEKKHGKIVLPQNSGEDGSSRQTAKEVFSK